MEIKQEALFLTEGWEGYIVLGTKSRKRAGQLIRKYEIEETGFKKGDTDLFHEEEDLEEVKIRTHEEETGGTYYSWSDKKSCEKCGTKLIYPIDGFIYSI